MSKDKKGISVVRLKLDVDEQTASQLDGQSKICNYLYNKLLEEANNLKIEFIKTQDSKVALKLYSRRGLRDLIPDMKKSHPFLKTVYSAPLKNGALRLSETIQNYQKSRKGKRKGKKNGWPKFRSWKRNWFSLFYDEPNKGFKIVDDKLMLSLGADIDGKRLRVLLGIKHADILKDKEIRNLRIVKTNGNYEAIFTIVRKIPNVKSIKKIISLDPNHKNLAYGVDKDGCAIEIKSPHWLKIYDKRIDELKSRRDRCQRRSRCKEIIYSDGQSAKIWEPSRRWNRLDEVVQKLLNKRREQTKTFIYTVANKLFQKYDCVTIGDYAPDGSGKTKRMRRAMNNRSLIGRFKEVLSWVAIKSGKHFWEFDERGTTRTCSKCSHIISGGISPDIREWMCPECQSEHIRDENAAQNGLKKTFNLLKEKMKDVTFIVPGSGLVHVCERWAWEVFPCGIRSMLRGLYSEKIALPRN